MPLYQYECSAGHAFDAIVPMAERNVPLPCEEDGCFECASMVITHSHPEAILDHGMARNSENAKMGKYDPLNPNTRFMSKGRNWRK